MKYIGIGTMLSILGVIGSILIWGKEEAHLLSGLLGGIFLVSAMLMSEPWQAAIECALISQQKQMKTETNAISS